MNRREFVLSTALALFWAGCTERKPRDVRSARALIAGLRSGAVKPQHLASRVWHAAQEAQDKYNIFIDLDEKSLRREFEMLKSMDKNLPLFGLPIAVKDNLAIAGFPRTAGARLIDSPPVMTADSWAVAQIRKAGAVPFARTNLTEFSLGVYTLSGYQGWTDNPLMPGHLSGGSSGGSAAAVAAGVCFAALGSDTSGSIRIPATLCGVWGFRPSRDAVNIDGLFRITKTRDAVGPLARNCDELAMVTDALLNLPESKPLDAREFAGINFVFDDSLYDKCAPEILSSLDDFKKALAGLTKKISVKRIENYDQIGEWVSENSTYEGLPALREQIRASFGVDMDAPETRTRMIARTRFVITGMEKKFAELKISSAEAHEAKRRKLADAVLNGVLTKNTILVQPVTLMPPVKRSNFARVGEARIFNAYTRPCILAPALKAPALSAPVFSGARGCGFQLLARPGEDRLLLRTGLFLEQKLPGGLVRRAEA